MKNKILISLFVALFFSTLGAMETPAYAKHGKKIAKKHKHHASSTAKGTANAASNKNTASPRTPASTVKAPQAPTTTVNK